MVRLPSGAAPESVPPRRGRPRRLSFGGACTGCTAPPAPAAPMGGMVAMWRRCSGASRADRRGVRASMDMRISRLPVKSSTKRRRIVRRPAAGSLMPDSWERRVLGSACPFGTRASRPQRTEGPGPKARESIKRAGRPRPSGRADPRFAPALGSGYAELGFHALCLIVMARYRPSTGGGRSPSPLTGKEAGWTRKRRSDGIRLEAAVREHPPPKRCGNAAPAPDFRFSTPGPGLPGEARPGLPSP